jgi:hypothetical protein
MEHVILQFGKASGSILTPVHHYKRTSPRRYQIYADDVSELSESIRQILLVDQL